MLQYSATTDRLGLFTLVVQGSAAYTLTNIGRLEFRPYKCTFDRIEAYANFCLTYPYGSSINDVTIIGEGVKEFVTTALRS